MMMILMILTKVSPSVLILISHKEEGVINYKQSPFFPSTKRSSLLSFIFAKLTSSRPMAPWTTIASVKFLNFNDSITNLPKCFARTPIKTRLGPAGLLRGPNKLNIVGIPISRRVFAAFFTAG